MKTALLLLVSAAAFAQDVELTPIEKQFQDSLTNVTLVGYFTAGDGADVHEDKYVIDRVSKIKDDTWKFEAHIQFNKKDMKVALPLPVKFAGDTPMISLTNFAVPGFGSFSARILFYEGSYAGTWSAAGGGHAGKMFGKIVKNETAAQ